MRLGVAAWSLAFAAVRATASTWPRADPTLMITLGRLLLRRYRIEAGLTQEDLAERAGLSARRVPDLERGLRRSPYPATTRRLAEALAPLGALFLTTPAAPGLASDDQRRVGSSVGLVGPVWLPPTVGPSHGWVLALAWTNNNGGHLAVRSVDLTTRLAVKQRLRQSLSSTQRVV
jgi:DNA-binding XRE family transcriptional regulator